MSTQQSNEGKHTRQKPRVNNNEKAPFIFVSKYIYIHAAKLNRKIDVVSKLETMIEPIDAKSVFSKGG